MLRRLARFYLFLINSIVLNIVAAQAVFAQAILENPQPGSFQSGIGIVSGWACEADRIDIEVSGGGVNATLQAAYGTARGDTAGRCGDTDNGFGLLVNWNILGDGNYTVRALRDGVEFARVTVIVSTLGLNQQFATGLTGDSQLPDFPQNGKTTRIRWQESIQNFSIIGATESPADGTPSSPRTKLENPGAGSLQSGISVISGWACEANRIDIEVNGAIMLQAAYGTERSDTAEACGDTNNGFGLLVNWNDLPDGVHTLRALKDGVEFARAVFTVSTLGLGSFVRGLSGGFVVSDFPQTGRHTRVQWQESTQNFAITGSVLPEIDEGLCTSATQSALDSSGGSATITATNPCQITGQIQIAEVRPQNNAALTSGNAPNLQAQSMGGFFVCDQNLTITQGGRTFTASDFDWLDSDGNAICRALAPGSSLSTFIKVKDGSPLNFNRPFDIVYTNQRLFQWTSASLPAPTIVDNTTAGGGPPIDCSLFGVPRQLQFCNGDTYKGVQYITLTSQCSVFLEGSVTIIADNNDFRVVAGKSFFLQPPSGGALIAIEYTGKCPATSRGQASIELEGTGVALTLLNPAQ
jgi:hypothetical protein